jgi:hypothetical protein
MGSSDSSISAWLLNRPSANHPTEFPDADPGMWNADRRDLPQESRIPIRSILDLA